MNWTARTLRWTAAVAIAALIAGAGWGWAGGGWSPGPAAPDIPWPGEDKPVAQVGTLAPDFALPLAGTGEFVRLSSLRGRHVVLFFGSCT